MDKDSLLRKWYFWTLIIIFVILVYLIINYDKIFGTDLITIEKNTITAENVVEKKEDLKEQPKEEVKEQVVEEKKVEVPKQETPVETVTLGQKNALKKAKSYLDFTAFSYSGLIKQLEFEGFTTEEATYGVEKCGADWNEQAAKKAKSYMDFSSFSRNGLLEQLKFEGFTDEQAEYGVNSVGY